MPGRVIFDLQQLKVIVPGNELYFSDRSGVMSGGQASISGGLVSVIFQPDDSICVL